ncbi:MAG TPA: AmmeMemoRadiSam system protein A [Usitatibacter sp.]|nr:AmmeMemoRadiSam system protein A [Usitatibacter sp.]
MLEPERGPVLIAIARESIARGREAPVVAGAWEAGWLREIGASFVTLKMADDLRGCIGTIDAHRPLGDDVARNARAAAYRDPRFPPVDAAELPRLQVEVSVLSPREALPVASESDALSKLRPGIDGIALEYNGASATFLPQVWESLPEPVDFLEHLRRKAGLPARFWHSDVRLSRYTVEKYL